MSQDRGVARTNLDRAGGPIGTGAKTVFVNDENCAIESSVITGAPNSGDIIVQSPVTVFAENKRVAVQGSITARGYAVGKASTNVFAGQG